MKYTDCDIKDIKWELNSLKEKYYHQQEKVDLIMDYLGVEVVEQPPRILVRKGKKTGAI